MTANPFNPIANSKEARVRQALREGRKKTIQ
jgi:hypothetical protein